MPLNKDRKPIIGNIYKYCGRCPWCNGYRRRKWTQRHEFKYWTRLIAFHIALMLYTVIKHNLRTSTKRTNTLLYKNIISHTLFLKGWCCLCVRAELETGTDYYILTQSSSDQSSTSFASWLGCSTGGHWGPQDPQSASWFSRWHPISNWLEPPRIPGYIIVLRPPASVVLPVIYTGAYLDWQLGRGSIYNTNWESYESNYSPSSYG